MSEWSEEFDTILGDLKEEGIFCNGVCGLLHGIAESWSHETTCMVWLSVVSDAGNNIFGSTTIFVNGEILDELQWTFAEWHDGTAFTGLFNAADAERVNLHLMSRSKLSIIAKVRHKTLPPETEGDDYVFHFVHDLPHSLRLAIAVPYPG